LGRAGDSHDIARHFLGSGRSLLNVARDFLCSNTLFFHCGRNCSRDLIDLVDRFCDRLNGLRRGTSRLLDLLNLEGDFFCGLGRLLRQILHLRSNHSKSLARLAGPSRFNRSV